LLSWLLVASFMANTAVTFFVLARLGFKRTVYELFQPSAGCIAGVLLLLAASAVLKINHTLGETTSLWLLGVKVLAMAGSYWLLISFTGDLDFLRKAVAPRLSKRTPRNSRFTVGL
jgi:teichuronic acid exporter